MTGRVAISATAKTIPSGATSQTPLTRNGRSRSGRVRRRTSTPEQTIVNDSSVPIETRSPRMSIGSSAATAAPATAQTTVAVVGVWNRLLTRPSRSGSIPSDDIRMKMRVCP